MTVTNSINNGYTQSKSVLTWHRGCYEGAAGEKKKRQMRITSSGRRWCLGATLGLFVALFLAPTAVIQGDNGGKKGRSERARGKERSERARAAAKGKGSTKMNLLVRFRQAPGASEHALVQALGGQERRRLKASSRWRSLRVPAHHLAALADNANVDYVGIDEPIMTAMDVAREASNEPTMYAPESALKGAGVTIVVVDSGVALHPDIETMTAVVDVVAQPNMPHAAPPEDSIDPNGHGTHVAGIMVGSGSRSAGRMAGVAPQASLISVRVLDGLGRGLTSDLLAGLQWILDHKDEHGIRVVNMSLGHPVFEPAAVDPLVEAVDSLWDAGLVVVCSAGNRGRSGHVTVTSPCNSRKVITVGATSDNHTAPITDDKIASYSSRGPTAFDLVAKPDLVAPGNRIVSLRSAGSRMDTLLPDRRVAADPAQPEAVEYFEMSGTSMASPIVAATAALMIEQDPSLNPGTVKARLMMSARKAAFGDPLTSGAGYLDILGALRATWIAADAPSPRALVDAETGTIAFENTAMLWGSDVFSLRALWAESVSWSDPTAYLQPFLQTNGEMWPPGAIEAQTELWPNSELWPESEMWPDSPAWSPAVTAPEETGPVATEALSSGFRDP
jgi:serine protease AprX